jgi:hypothetical protein
MRTAEKHLAAINAGTVTKSNVIGIRKALNAAERRHAGYSVSRVAPNVTRDELFTIGQRLRMMEPRVTGDLRASGLKLLRDPRYAKRFDERQRGIIERDDAEFSLMRFDWIDGHAYPVYRIMAPPGYHERPNGHGWRTGGSFLFRALPWQAVAYGNSDEIGGPVVIEEN